MARKASTKSNAEKRGRNADSQAQKRRTRAERYERFQEKQRIKNKKKKDAGVYMGQAKLNEEEKIVYTASKSIKKEIRKKLKESLV